MNSLFKQYDRVFEEKEPEVGKKNTDWAYSPFALQDAIGEKNVKKSWIEYEKLRLSGIGADEIIFNIVNKIKDMTAIIIGADIETLGIKDRIYNKSKIDTKNWTEIELKNFYNKLVALYHGSRMGGDELDLAIEKILLSI